jgi:hypothetical protein
VWEWGSGKDGELTIGFEALLSAKEGATDAEPCKRWVSVEKRRGEDTLAAGRTLETRGRVSVWAGRALAEDDRAHGQRQRHVAGIFSVNQVRIGTNQGMNQVRIGILLSMGDLAAVDYRKVIYHR